MSRRPRHRLHIQQIPLRLRTTLHHTIIPNQQDQQVDQPTGLFSGLLGRQQEVLTSGSYDIDAGMFEVITVADAYLVEKEHLTMADLYEVAIDRGEVGVVMAHVGAAPEFRTMIGRVVSGHDSFQRPWEFLANGGQWGVQEEVLAGGRSYAINPWFAQVVRIPTRVLTLNQIELAQQGQVIRRNLKLAMMISPVAAPRLVRLLETPSTRGSDSAWLQITRSLERMLSNHFGQGHELGSDQLDDEIRAVLAPLGISEISVTLDPPDSTATRAISAPSPPGDIARLLQEALDTYREDPQPAAEYGIPDWLKPVLSEQAEDAPDETPIRSGRGGTAVLTDTAEVSIYLSDSGAAEQVERAVEGFLALAGAEVVGRDDPVLGSWFRRMQAKVGGEVAASAAHAIDTRFVLGPDAVVAKDLLTGLAPVIGALGSVEQAVIRVGALLIVKADGRLSVCQLTAKQQLELDHNPSLATAPHEILGALQFGVNGSPRPIAELDQGRGEGAPGGGGMARVGPGAFLESRTAAPVSANATSTQSPPESWL